MKVTYLSFERVSSRLVASLVPREVPPELISDVEIFGVSETYRVAQGPYQQYDPSPPRFFSEPVSLQA